MQTLVFDSSVYQPIFDLPDNRIIGFESLARFAVAPVRSPDIWFAEAAKIGLSVELEIKALRLAVDDAGAGYASFRHILKLVPDLIKLDRSITRSIDMDRLQRALARALPGFDADTNSKVVAWRERIINADLTVYVCKPSPARAPGLHHVVPDQAQQLKLASVYGLKSSGAPGGMGGDFLSESWKSLIILRMGPLTQLCVVLTSDSSLGSWTRLNR